MTNPLPLLDARLLRPLSPLERRVGAVGVGVALALLAAMAATCHAAVEKGHRFRAEQHRLADEAWRRSWQVAAAAPRSTPAVRAAATPAAASPAADGS